MMKETLKLKRLLQETILGGPKQLVEIEECGTSWPVTGRIGRIGLMTG